MLKLTLKYLSMYVGAFAMNIWLRLVFLISMINLASAAEVSIVPMTQELAVPAREIVVSAVEQLQIIACVDRADLEAKLEQDHVLDDFKDIDGFYTNHGGLFLAMVCDGQVIGMGAIKQLDRETCELKRMFFASEMRGQGLGSRMLATLIARAKELGYQKMRLDVYNPITQTRAVNLYKKFGFYEISPYSSSPAKLFMEKVL